MHHPALLLILYIYIHLYPLSPPLTLTLCAFFLLLFFHSHTATTYPEAWMSTQLSNNRWMSAQISSNTLRLQARMEWNEKQNKHPLESTSTRVSRRRHIVASRPTLPAQRPTNPKQSSPSRARLAPPAERRVKAKQPSVAELREALTRVEVIERAKGIHERSRGNTSW